MFVFEAQWFSWWSRRTDFLELRRSSPSRCVGSGIQTIRWRRCSVSHCKRLQETTSVTGLLVICYSPNFHEFRIHVSCKCSPIFVSNGSLWWQVFLISYQNDWNTMWVKENNSQYSSLRNIVMWQTYDFVTLLTARFQSNPVACHTGSSLLQSSFDC